jgi:hypothetical protein
MWKTYGAHALAYIIGGLTLVQAYAGVVPGKGTVIAAGATVLLTAINHLQALAANSTTTLPAPSAGTTVKSLAPFALVLLGAGLAISGLSGCSLFSKLTTPAAQPYITAAVDVAVATAESKGIPSAQINSICKTALAADQGTAATLATVAAVVNAELARLNLPPGDLAAAQILEDALSVAIQAQVGANPKVATAQAAIANVLSAAITATGG